MVKNLVAGDSLRARIVRGGALMSTGSAAEHLLRFVRNMILTRLLLPEALGVMTIILAINAALEAFTEVGIREAVVQHKDAENGSFLNAAWWLACTRAAILFTAGITFAPLLTSFYAIPHAVNLLRISFVAILFNGTLSSRAFVAMKKMQYGKWVAVMEGGSIGGIIVTLVLVWVFHDIRALVLGYVAESVLRTTLSFIICPYLPRLSFDKEQSRVLFRFARGMAGVPLLTFVFMQADIFFLGKMISKHDIGLYGMAGTLAGIPGIAISVLINPVMMPVFSQMRDAQERLNEMLVRITRAMSVMGLPAAAFVMVFGDMLIGIIYGKEYSPAGTVLGLLFLTSLSRTIASPIPAIYLGLGKPALNRTFAAIRTTSSACCHFPSYKALGDERRCRCLSYRDECRMDHPGAPYAHSYRS